MKKKRRKREATARQVDTTSTVAVGTQPVSDFFSQSLLSSMRHSSRIVVVDWEGRYMAYSRSLKTPYVGGKEDG